MATVNDTEQPMLSIALDHPAQAVQVRKMDIDDPYVERCWTHVVGLTAATTGPRSNNRGLDVWAPRSQYASGEAWPAPVDLRLDPALQVEDVARWVPLARVLCSTTQRGSQDGSL